MLLLSGNFPALSGIGSLRLCAYFSSDRMGPPSPALTTSTGLYVCMNRVIISADPCHSTGSSSDRTEAPCITRPLSRRTASHDALIALPPHGSNSVKRMMGCVRACVLVPMGPPWVLAVDG